ncbi:type II methionyl aminopeptidase [archaeon]|nr:type II methionyl aminopeptidase [archaeon]
MDYEKYIEAGKIAAGIMEEGIAMIKPGVKLLRVANDIEGLIEERGAKPAFPVNISLNAVAAHYSPDAWDESIFEKGDLVKLDLGVHLDGYIADIAKSKDLGENKDLVNASTEALENAIDAMKPGAMTNEVGAIIEETIKGYGFRPVSNLTGHMLRQWNLHGGIIIPNVSTRHGDQIEEGSVFAIEPFATDGAGRVVDETNAIIFRYIADRPVRMKEARDILKHVKTNFGSLPFAERWVSGMTSRIKLTQALRQLILQKALYAYHILREKEHGTVSQAEHTVIVKEDGCEVTTRA